jgi:hypothetical protein
MRFFEKSRGFLNRKRRINEFSALAVHCGTDKSAYADLYVDLLEPLRYSSLNILEVGVLFGSSLKLWAQYFPNAHSVVGLDVFDPSRFERGVGQFPGSVSTLKEQSDYYFEQIETKLRYDDRIKCFRVNTRLRDEKVDDFGATSVSAIGSQLHEIGKFDLIIDDGSHRQSSFDLTLAHLLPHLTSNGIYVIEDIDCNRDRGEAPSRICYEKFKATGNFESKFIEAIDQRKIEEFFSPDRSFFFRDRVMVLR